MELTKEFLEDNGYTNLRQINGKWYGILRMIFTTGIVCDLNHTGNSGGRICFHTHADATRFLETWDGETAPTEADGMAADKRVASNEITDEARKVFDVITPHMITITDEIMKQKLNPAVFSVCMIRTAIDLHVQFAKRYKQSPEATKDRLRKIMIIQIEEALSGE